MALIHCPECGNTVSDKAQSCPVCAYPIASSNPSGTVYIKIANGLAGKVRIINTLTEQELWLGRAGQIAEINVEGATPIGITWGLGSKPHPEHCAVVKARERYSLSRQQGFMVGSFVLNKVDVIDSE